MLEHRKMHHRLLPLLVAVSLGALALGTGGCNRTGDQGPAHPQPIRDEKEPGESVDYLSAVPETSSNTVEEMSSGSSENEVEIDDDASDSDDDGGKEGGKSADKSDDDDKDGESGDGGEDETGDEPGGDIDVEVDP